MKIDAKKVTQCAKCNRVVYTSDVDTVGYCVFCKPATELDDDGLGRHPVATVSPKKTGQKEKKGRRS